MNRTALLIPALCGKLDKTTIALALNLASHRDLQMWEAKNIPYTVRKKRKHPAGPRFRPIAYSSFF